MYLPATGFQNLVEKDKNKLKVESIANISAMYKATAVEAPQKPGSDNNSAKIEKHEQQTAEISGNERKDSCQNPKGINPMSTQDFMVLRSQSSDETYKALDSVIAKMKENMETIGDAVEAISEMTKKSSKENLALQVLQKTLEAMDENKGDS